MPRPPKDPNLRQRRNQEVTSATLIESSPLQEGVPDLPERDDGDEWHPRAAQLWGELWTSPMATEYTKADSHRIEAYVDLFHRLKLKFSTALAAELRLQGVCLGVTPIDRRRLQWEIKRAEPESKPKPKKADRRDDPRGGLRAVS